MSAHRLTLSMPIPVRVAPHPWLPGRFTHTVDRQDALARGWMTFGDLPLGAWRTRAAAQSYARKLQARGVVTIRKVRA